MPDPQVRDAIRAQYRQQVSDLSGRLNSGTISLDDWQAGMKQNLRDSYALNLRAGSDKPLRYTEYLKLGSPLQKQYKFLNQFKADIAAGGLSGAVIASRAALYILSAVQMYWRQVTNGYDLPDYPPEHPNCGCEWVQEDDGWHWVRSKDDSCDICVQREQDWNPYVPSTGADDTH